MAKRPIIDKKVAAMRRSLRKGRLPRFFDLVDWLKDRGYAQTTGQAERLILDEKVRADSHPLGVHTLDLKGPDGKLKPTRLVYRLVPIDLRNKVVVKA